MRPLAKVGLVTGGYIVAFLLASAAVAARIASTSGPVAQASSGMYAFGDAVVFVAIFGACAVVPTAIALIFLRPYPRFWTVLGTLALAVALTGIAAVVLFAVGRDATSSPLARWAQFSVLRILLAPVLAFTFLVCTALSPHRPQRIALLAATLMEVAVSAYGLFVWFIPMLLHRS